jgi:predicted nucleic acid-binding protein
VFLDASVLVFAVERPRSNSARIVELALSGGVEVVVDEVVLLEVRRYLRRRASRLSHRAGRGFRALRGI